MPDAGHVCSHPSSPRKRGLRDELGGATKVPGVRPA